MLPIRKGCSWPPWVLTALLLVVFGCQEAPVQPPQLTGVSAVTGVENIVGDIGPGSQYAILVPPDWNGDLILYAHGFIDTDVPIGLPEGDGWPPIRDELLDQGYAIAYSSYSENGLAVKDGAQRTHQLEGIFEETYGEPTRKYLVGHSLGGLVDVMLMEKYPKRYDGALVMCGMIGGSQAEIDYVATVRVLFDYLYPTCLPGDAMNVPPGTDLNAIITAIVTCITMDPTGAGIIPYLAPVPFSTPNELVESLVRAIGFNFRGFEDVFDRTHDHYPFDNSAVVYSSPFLPQPLLDAINAGVDRFEETRDAYQYLKHYYEPKGNLRTPLLTVHTSMDPVVPIFHEGLYAQRVLDAGNSDLLVQRTITRYGHCSQIMTGEAVAAFADLVNWVENGVKPAP